MQTQYDRNSIEIMIATLVRILTARLSAELEGRQRGMTRHCGPDLKAGQSTGLFGRSVSLVRVGRSPESFHDTGPLIRGSGISTVHEGGGTRDIRELRTLGFIRVLKSEADLPSV